MNFITKHIITKIGDLVVQKQRILKCDGFFYFDSDIKDPRIIINRINRWNVFPKQEILPISWYMLDALTLLKIFNKINNNKFYVYKNIDKIDYRVRIKKDGQLNRF